MWLYTNGPTSKVEFDFSETGIARYQDRVEPIRFALISDVHLRETPREEITNEQDTKSILEKFMQSMNNEIRPDFIVQLGDFNDGCLESCNEVISDDKIIGRLQRAESYTQRKTDIPWYDVIGNHEYFSGYDADRRLIPNKDFSAIYKAIDQNWSKLEDTWYYRDIKGYRFIFLNTAFPQTGLSHLIPLEEIDWLRELLESTDKPTFVFMHVPVSGGTGTAYDLAVNREQVAALLAESESFVFGFFGHSHHSDRWDGLRKQLDQAGNTYFHVTAPHEWMGNRSSYPWVVVTIDPERNRISIEAGSAVERSELLEFAHYWKQRLQKFAARLLG